MPSENLHLKETPAEQAERELRKARKAARRAAKKRQRASDESSDDPYTTHAGPSSKRPRAAATDPGAYPYVFGEGEGECGPPPPPSSHAHKHDYTDDGDYERAFRAAEEARFREKMFDAMEADERLDALEARMNDYAHIPRRWRGGGMDRMDDDASIDPHMMEEEDYAEWVRAGMWRRKHAAEHAEQERKKAERAARKAREKAVREETARLEHKAEAERARRRRSGERRRAADTHRLYDARWGELLAADRGGEGDLLRFSDIPWPVMPRNSGKLALEDLTMEAITTFLVLHGDGDTENGEEMKKERKDKLRETMLRFHPDKFEGRVMKRVRECDREMVKEGVGIVVRAVTELMGNVK